MDCDNRGCEAIARGTIEVLGLGDEQYIGLTTNMSLDNKMGMNKICTLRDKRKVSKIYQYYVRIKRRLRICPDLDEYYARVYDPFMNSITYDGICMITGGDMFCYGDNELNYIIHIMNQRKVITVLWGCSFVPENLTHMKLKALKQISLITTRESLTYDYFSKDLKLKNVHLVSDPAFTLKPEIVSLPQYFKNDIIGINLSNFTCEKYSDDNAFFKTFIAFLEYIIKNTNLMIVLIPHVFWLNQDDRIVCRLIQERLNNEERVKLLNTEQMNYCQIRYAISKCDYFIGARTHAMISAYSTCTPAIALGYSIKARGIAKDLGLDENLVIDYREVKCVEDLIERFEYMTCNGEIIRAHLKDIMPEYILKAYSARGVIENLLK